MGVVEGRVGTVEALILFTWKSGVDAPVMAKFEPPENCWVAPASSCSPIVMEPADAAVHVSASSEALSNRIFRMWDFLMLTEGSWPVKGERPDPSIRAFWR